MPNYKGVEINARVRKCDDSDEFYGKFTLTEHKGNEVIDHQEQYVTINNGKDLVKFPTEQDAISAAESVAIQIIDKL